MNPKEVHGSNILNTQKHLVSIGKKCKAFADQCQFTSNLQHNKSSKQWKKFKNSRLKEINLDRGEVDLGMVIKTWWVNTE